MRIELEVAKENDLLFQDVAIIHDSQYKFVAETMDRGEFEPVLLPYLGKFLVKPKRLKKFNERMAKKVRRKNAETPDNG